MISEVLTDNRTLGITFPASTAFSRGTLLALVAHVPTDPATFSDQGSVAANQAYFTPLFLGVMQDARLVGETSLTGTSGNSDRVIVTDGIFDCDCTAATFNVGDLVGIDRSSVPGFYNQQVVAVTNPALAIGIVVKAGTSVTSVRCRLISRVANNPIWNLVAAESPLLSARCSAQLDKTSSTAFTAITGILLNVAAGAKYKIRGTLFITATANGGVKLETSGTATATSCVIETADWNGATIGTVTQVAALGTLISHLEASTKIVIDGEIVVNAAGTLSLSFAQNTSHADTSSVLVGSNLILEPLP